MSSTGLSKDVSARIEVAISSLAFWLAQISCPLRGVAVAVNLFFISSAQRLLPAEAVSQVELCQ